MKAIVYEYLQDYALSNFTIKGYVLPLPQPQHGGGNTA